MEGHRHLPTRPGRLDAMAAVGYGYPVAMRLQDTTEPAQSRQRGCRVIAPRGGRQRYMVDTGLPVTVQHRGQIGPRREKGRGPWQQSVTDGQIVREWSREKVCHRGEIQVGDGSLH